MTYKNIREGIFISRPNRFISLVEIDGKEEICHVKNTGRCKEILKEGTKVLLQEFDSPKRKTKFDLISAYKGNELINIDSQAPNKLFAEWAKKTAFFGKDAMFKAEKKYGNSRFDFYIEADSKKIFVEVKGVTLETDGVAAFPDAPTERGVKHINELCKAVDDGFEAYIFFVIQMKNIKKLIPNRKTHPEFGKALEAASEKGVKIFAIDCKVSPGEVWADRFVDVCI
ncbi:MAG: DNA/RNA nuclease SfsA [Clostridia bacterium]|nr:DNA/RNA nuclease SfsA [Clostridia bacterium]